jgi:hypothetical protein
VTGLEIATPLSTSGRFIVDARGKRVRLAGVNWYGAHEDLGVAPGLDRTDRRTLARRIAGLGFNSVRLPFSLWMTEQTAPVPDQYLAANPAPAQAGQAGSAVWWHNFHSWLTDNDVDWCWWALNPTQPKGTVPVANRHRSNWGDPETWGLLTPDWRGVANPGVLDLLKSMIPPRTGPGTI